MSSYELTEYSLLKPTGSKFFLKDSESLKDQWQSTHPTPGCKLLLSLKDHHMTVTSHNTTLESYFLLSSGINMKCVCKKDSLVILYKTKTQTRIFKLKFFNKIGEFKEKEFSKQIENYLQVRYESTENEEQCSTNNAPRLEKLGDFVQSLLRQNENKLPEIYRQNSIYASSADLDNMVYLCITDPNFAGFVGKVDECLKKFQSN